MSERYFNPFRYRDLDSPRYRPPVADVRILSGKFERLAEDHARLLRMLNDAEEKINGYESGLSVGADGLTDQQLNAIIEATRYELEAGERWRQPFDIARARCNARAWMVRPRQDEATAAD